MDRQWYYQRPDGTVVGPLSYNEYAEFVRTGEIGPETLVGTSTPDATPLAWIPARETQAFHAGELPATSVTSRVTAIAGLLLLFAGAIMPSLTLAIAGVLFFAVQQIVDRLDELLWLQRNRQ